MRSRRPSSSALPESDIVVHVEPTADEAALRERVHAAALTVAARARGAQPARRRGRGRPPGRAAPEAARRAVARGRARRGLGGRAARSRDAVPEVLSVQTHLEPLREPGAGRAPEEADVEARRRGGQADRPASEPGSPPRELRFLQTDDGLVAFLTLGVDPESALAEAHALASEVEEDDPPRPSGARRR